VLLEGERFARRHGYAGEIARIARALRLCGVHRSVRRRRSDNGLTGREREVLLLVGQGLSNQEIARRLGVGRPTVARIVQSAARKLGAETRAQAAALAAQA
jgi:DNA-binding CsgD family transcriptional regulator